jgi:NAD(P)-dependent dehydrogenase (short-subunit alcohol dehydrogenase family)
VDNPVARAYRDSHASIGGGADSDARHHLQADEHPSGKENPRLSLPAWFSDRYGPGPGRRRLDGIGRLWHRPVSAGITWYWSPARCQLATLADELRRSYGVDARCKGGPPRAMGEIRQATDDIESRGLLPVPRMAPCISRPPWKPHRHDFLNTAALCCWPTISVSASARGGIMLLSSMAAMSGGSYIAVYNATKSFDMVLAEGLWHELKPVGVDAMCLVVGATLTPSMLASRDSFRSYPNIMQPLDVADEGLAFLGRGPLWVAGDHNRAVVAAMRPGSRVDAINGLSHATASIYGLPPVTVAGEDFNA